MGCLRPPRTLSFCAGNKKQDRSVQTHDKNETRGPGVTESGKEATPVPRRVGGNPECHYKICGSPTMNALREFWAKSLLNKLLLVGLVGVVCCCPLGLAGVGGGGGTATTGATATAEGAARAESAATAGPTATPAPTETPAPPTPTLEPSAALEAAVRGALGRSNRDVERVTAVNYDGAIVDVQWTINDNLTEGMIKGGAKRDVIAILRAVVKSGVPFTEVMVRGTFPLIDVYGNTKEQQVISASYTAETIARINFDGIDPDNIYIISDNAIVHPAFRDE